MAINKNHEFDDLDGIKCAVVEKNVSAERTEFLKGLLEYNGFTVVVVKSPPPKTAAKPATPVPAEPVPATDAATAPASAPESPALPETFTVGVTDSTFNSTNAIFGRLLKTKDGHVVSLAYWNQLEKISDDETPYYEKHFKN